MKRNISKFLIKNINLKYFSNFSYLNSNLIEKNRLSRKSVLIYKDILKDKQHMQEALKNKSGIYMWINNTNKKIYIGSSIDLRNRITSYLKNSVLIRDSSMPICTALLKYGYSEFTLEVLEFCDKDKVIERENYYFELFQPEYNIVKVAGQPPRIDYTPEIKKKISDSLKEFFANVENREIRSLSKQGYEFIVIDILDDTVTQYHAIKAAARKLNIDRRIITKALKSETEMIISDRYIFKSLGEMENLGNKVQASSKTISVLDLETNIKTTYESITSAANALNVYPQSLNTYLKNKSDKPFKNRYILNLE